jgi:sec-independent protein translocase protein TatA
MFGGIGMQEILIILLIILLLFGAKKIPEMAKGLGKGIREFKKAAKDVKDQVDVAAEDDEKVEEKDKEKKQLEG